MLASFGDVRVEYAPLYSERCRLAYVWGISDRENWFELKFFPDTVTIQNEGKGTGKGDMITILENWWRLIEKTNDVRGFIYARSVGAMWINKDNSGAYKPDDKYTQGNAESIICGGNFVKIIDETQTHYRIAAWENNLDTDTLNPEFHNWFNMPHMFWKARAIKRDGGDMEVINPNTGWDVYIPIIAPAKRASRPAELWIEKRKVKYLGENDWQFHRGEVYLDGRLYHPTGAVKPRYDK